MNNPIATFSSAEGTFNIQADPHLTQLNGQFFPNILKKPSDAYDVFPRCPVFLRFTSDDLEAFTEQEIARYEQKISEHYSKTPNLFYMDNSTHYNNQGEVTKHDSLSVLGHSAVTPFIRDRLGANDLLLALTNTLHLSMQKMQKNPENPEQDILCQMTTHPVAVVIDKPTSLTAPTNIRIFVNCYAIENLMKMEKSRPQQVSRLARSEKTATFTLSAQLVHATQDEKIGVQLQITGAECVVYDNFLLTQIKQLASYQRIPHQSFSPSDIANYTQLSFAKILERTKHDDEFKFACCEGNLSPLFLEEEKSAIKEWPAEKPFDPARNLIFSLEELLKQEPSSISAIFLLDCITKNPDSFEALDEGKLKERLVSHLHMIETSTLEEAILKHPEFKKTPLLYGYLKQAAKDKGVHFTEDSLVEQVTNISNAHYTQICGRLQQGQLSESTDIYDALPVGFFNEPEKFAQSLGITELAQHRPSNHFKLLGTTKKTEDDETSEEQEALAKRLELVNQLNRLKALFKKNPPKGDTLLAFSFKDTVSGYQEFDKELLESIAQRVFTSYFEAHPNQTQFDPESFGYFVAGAHPLYNALDSLIPFVDFDHTEGTHAATVGKIVHDDADAFASSLDDLNTINFIIAGFKKQKPTDYELLDYQYGPSSLHESVEFHGKLVKQRLLARIAGTCYSYYIEKVANENKKQQLEHLLAYYRFANGILGNIQKIADNPPLPAHLAQKGLPDILDMATLALESHKETLTNYPAEIQDKVSLLSEEALEVIQLYKQFVLQKTDPQHVIDRKRIKQFIRRTRNPDEQKRRLFLVVEFDKTGEMCKKLFWKSDIAKGVLSIDSDNTQSLLFRKTITKLNLDDDDFNRVKKILLNNHREAELAGHDETARLLFSIVENIALSRLHSVTSEQSSPRSRNGSGPTSPRQ